ncbi:hypothetical protein [Lentzea sp.]|uniref:hypothetical protein n=1 Tax=Lentzea sp. TaxID=56099 RepID=UPI002C8DD26D|nr:hypothetical protein [Lentzea sp.]HUQ59065.1 hypothetical protein [Lentzea sp.]
MTRYDAVEAFAYRVAREISLTGLPSWRSAVTPYVAPGRVVLDLGAGTGLFTRAFRVWSPDVVRELIDGATGMQDGNSNMPAVPASFWVEHHARVEEIAAASAPSLQG